MDQAQLVLMSLVRRLLREMGILLIIGHRLEKALINGDWTREPFEKRNAGQVLMLT